MSVLETNIIDGMGKTRGDNELNLLLTDHLDWENEYEHLIILQEKLNAYIGYIESKQYEEIYPNETFRHFVINVRFKEDITEACFKFLDTIANQVEALNITIQAELSE